MALERLTDINKRWNESLPSGLSPVTGEVLINCSDNDTWEYKSTMKTVSNAIKTLLKMLLFLPETTACWRRITWNLWRHIYITFSTFCWRSTSISIIRINSVRRVLSYKCCYATNNNNIACNGSKTNTKRFISPLHLAELLWNANNRANLAFNSNAFR